MIQTIEEFQKGWATESEGTSKILGALTDASLNQAVTPKDRTLGRMAWHMVTAIPEMMERTGLKLSGPSHDSAPPASAKTILESYERVSGSLIEELRKSWTDETLKVEDDMYGEMWSRAMSLYVLIIHQIHHRAQMTVLMRQAGLAVPGVYGPSREEWHNYGAEPPAV